LLNKEIDYSDNLNTREKILVEVNVFERLYQNSFVVNIMGDSMEPFYSEGDYVGGLALEKDEYQKAP
jgi:phage repressor protein C with HTH and peptisase S24 domain